MNPSNGSPNAPDFRLGRIPDRAPLAVGGISLQPEITPSRTVQDIEDRRGEAKRIVKRLLAIIADHHSSAVLIGVALDQSLLLKVISALEAETQGKDPSPLLYIDNEVHAYLMRALYEELLEEPSNVLFTTQISPETIRYEAMEVRFWQECLSELKSQLSDS
jgi:hypothetical protein